MFTQSNEPLNIPAGELAKRVLNETAKAIEQTEAVIVASFASGFDGNPKFLAALSRIEEEWLSGLCEARRC